MNVAMVSPWNRSAFSLFAHLSASFGVEFELPPLRPRMNIVHPKRLVRLPAMRKLFAAVGLLSAGGALAGEAVLVHDIAPPHPRYTQLAQMAAEMAKRTQGTLTIAINPGGKVLYPGQASLDAVRNKTIPLAFINSAFLQSIDPDLGFLNLPFTITDQLMAKPAVAEGVLALVRSYVEPRGLKVFALMRGADTIVIFKNRQVQTPDDMKGLKIRIAGPGVYQDIVRSLGAEPVVFPAIEMGAALARGAMDGIITSPGAGARTYRTRRARASFRGCCSIP